MMLKDAVISCHTLNNLLHSKPDDKVELSLGVSSTDLQGSWKNKINTNHLDPLSLAAMSRLFCIK